MSQGHVSWPRAPCAGRTEVMPALDQDEMMLKWFLYLNIFPTTNSNRAKAMRRCSTRYIWGHGQREKPRHMVRHRAKQSTTGEQSEERRQKIETTTFALSLIWKNEKWACSKNGFSWMLSHNGLHRFVPIKRREGNTDSISRIWCGNIGGSVGPKSRRGGGHTVPLLSHR